MPNRSNFPKKKKIIRITTVPISLSGLLQGQFKFMGQFYEMVGISSDGGKLAEVGEKECLRVIPVEMTRKITPIKDLLALIVLWRVFRKEKPFIVHSHTPKAGTLGMLAAKLAGVPHRLHTVAGLPLVEATGFKRKLLNAVERFTYACSTKVYPNSIGLKNIILDHKFTGPEKLTVIGHGSSNGIDTSHFDPALNNIEQIRELKKELRLIEDDFVFVFVGRLVGDKGINELIIAFKRLVEEYPNIKLVLVGPFEKDLDPLLPETFDFIFKSENVVAVGWVDDVRPFFALSDCLAFPSYREGFPNVVMQAGAMGLYSIVTDINGCNEIIQNGINGIIVPPKDSTSLYQAMKQVLIERDKLALNKPIYRELIKNRFEREFIWNELLKEYQKL